MSGFNVYALDSPQVARTIRRRIEQERAEYAVLLSQPNIVKDWDDYQRRIGLIEGLDIALRTCEEVEREQEHR